MSNFAIDVLDQLIQAPDDGVRWEISNRLIRDLGGNAVNFGLVDVEKSMPIWLRSSMTSVWLEEYFQQEFFLVDPFIDHLGKSGDPLNLIAGTMTKDDAKCAKSYDLNWGVRDAGYQTLHFIPLGGEKKGTARAFTYCSEFDAKDTLNEENREKIKIVAALSSAYMNAPCAGNDVYHQVSMRLTAQEKRVLQKLVLGTRNAAIAHELDIAEVTVRKHLISIREKLGAKTREQAVSIAVSLGLLDL